MPLTDKPANTFMSADALRPSITDRQRADLRSLCDAFAEQLHRSLLEVLDTALRQLEPQTEQRPPAPEELAWAGLPSGETLSARENEVLAQLAAGHSNKVIAQTLGVSPHTIKRHVANILGKLGASSRVQAAAWCGAARH